MTGLLLFGAVAGVGYALWPDQRHTSGPHSGVPVAQGDYRESAPSLIAAASSQKQEPPPHLRRAMGGYIPDDGYEWASPATADLRVIWSPGLASSVHPNIVAAKTEGVWLPAAGFTWFDGTTAGRGAKENLWVKTVEATTFHSTGHVQSCGDSPTQPCWYFCRSRSAYYPFVRHCLEPWVPE